MFLEEIPKIISRINKSLQNVRACSLERNFKKWFEGKDEAIEEDFIVKISEEGGAVIKKYVCRAHVYTLTK